MERNYEDVGQHVIYIDANRIPRPALVQTWWPQMGGSGQPGCNLIVVSDDEKRRDQYGRQTEHFTSVVHKSAQPAGGWCWCWPDEL
jgi:hypothetical protein